MICPNCQSENRDGVRFCKQCGFPLEDPTRSQANASSGDISSGDSSSMMLCPNCGLPLRTRARFCKGCGARIGADALIKARSGRSTGQQTPAGTPPPPSTSTNICPNCGAELRENARFCNQCGTSLPGTGPTPGAKTGERCGQCGELLRPGTRFCRACGAPIEDRIQAQPAVSHPTPPQPFGTGTLLPMQVVAGRYLILEKIAQGGMGAIYKAQDQRLQGKVVALKEMSEQAIKPSERADVLAAFIREAELLARLDHPNLVRVTDRFQEGERHYMVMEFIEGETLDTLIMGRAEPFPEQQVLAWASQLCDVLAFLHSQDPPIIYRDIKPSNIMVTRETQEVKLIDFGIARFYKPGKKRDTIQFGTDGYAPPEQYGKAQTDERADVYALGATLHQLLTLHDPATRLFDFPDVRTLNTSIERRVERAITTALEMNKSKRHQSMADFWEALSGQQPRWFHTSTSVSTGGESKAPSKKRAVAQTGTGPLDFGQIKPGRGVSKVTRKISHPAGDEISVTADATWLQVKPKRMGQSGGEIVVAVRTDELNTGRLHLKGGPLRWWLGLHTSRLVPTQREYQSQIVVKHDDGQEESYPVSVTVKPDGWQVGTGWFMTLLAVLMEVGITLSVVVAILMSAGMI